MTPDVNVLVAASRSDHPHHAVARTWLEEALSAAEDGAAFTLMPMVLASLLRPVTSPNTLVQPTPITEAVAFVDAIVSAPGVQLASLGPEWPKLRQLCLEKQLAGNDLPDGWLAAAVDHHAEQLVSFGADRRRAQDMRAVVAADRQLRKPQDCSAAALWAIASGVCACAGSPCPSF
jgi:toxin-antitoxin system PIN domain toxin